MLALVGLLAVILLLIVAIFIFSKRKGDKAKTEEGEAEAEEAEAEEETDVSTGPAAGRSGLRRRRGARERLREQLQQRRQNGENAEEEGEEEYEEGEDATEEEIERLHSEGKIGTKKMQKLLAKEERRRAREAMEKEREERLEREEQEYLERKEREKEEERQREEEEARIKEEKRKAEEEEYNKWKDMLTIEEEGSEEASGENEGDLLQRFCDHIRKHKIIVLEDLAKAFKLKTASAIERVQQLEEMGKITGVFDDRGKFIYITDDEMKAVAKFIQRRGRLSIADLVDESNKLIDLEEKDVDDDEGQMVDDAK